MSSSLSSPRAVSIITGTRLYCRMVFNTSQPFIFGIITSRIISAMSF